MTMTKFTFKKDLLIVKLSRLLKLECFGFKGNQEVGYVWPTFSYKVVERFGCKQMEIATTLWDKKVGHSIFPDFSNNTPRKVCVLEVLIMKLVKHPLNSKHLGHVT